MANIEPRFPGETKFSKARMDVTLVFGNTREERHCKSVAMWAAEQI
jgi:hypothetical protein